MEFGPANSSGASYRKTWQNISILGEGKTHLGDVYISENKEQARFQKFLESLHFPEIYMRQQEIEQAHRDTFQWIFQPPRDADRTWDSFIDWLKHPVADKPYWVEGKPGCGKSTLMSFVLDQQGTVEALCEWAHPKTPTVLSFFFWEAGSPLQKNSIGLLRSLLWQLFDQNSQRGPELMETMGLGASSEIWTHRRLLDLFSRSLKVLDSPTCIFLDGLDEFADPTVLIELIEILKDFPLVKLCLSSRPMPKFVLAFQGFPKLKLENLTAHDMRKYVSDNFLNYPLALESDLFRCHADSRDLFVEQIVRKAQGVFLWLRLVIRSLQDGLENGDDLELLQSRLDDAASEIEDLFLQMLTRSKRDQKRYAEAATKYFQLLLSGERNISLPEFAIAIQPQVQDKYLSPSNIWDSRSLARDMDCRKVQTWISARSAGLLEVVHIPAPFVPFPYHLAPGIPPSNTVYDEYGVLNACETTEVSFIHRTVREFLLFHEGGKKLLCTSDAAEIEAKSALFRAKLLLTILEFSTVSMEKHPSLHKLEQAMKSTPDDPSYFSLFIQAKDVLNRVCEQKLMPTVSHWYHEVVLYEDLYNKSPQNFLPESVAQSAWSHPVDFLSFAAFFTKFRFVLEVFRTSERDTFTVRHLTTILSVAIAREWISVSGGNSDFTELLRAFFDAGVSPNDVWYDESLPLCPAKLCKSSLFQLFLARISRTMTSDDQRWTKHKNPEVIEMTKLFLRYGAKPGMDISPFSDFRGSHYLNIRARPRENLLFYELNTVDILRDPSARLTVPIRTAICAVLKEVGFESNHRVRLWYHNCNRWYIVNARDSRKLLSQQNKGVHYEYGHSVRNVSISDEGIVAQSVCLRTMEDALRYLGWTKRDLLNISRFYEDMHNIPVINANSPPSYLLEQWFYESWKRTAWSSSEHFDPSIDTEWMNSGQSHKICLSDASGKHLDLGQNPGRPLVLLPYHEAEEEFQSKAIPKLQLPLGFPPVRRYSF